MVSGSIQSETKYHRNYPELVFRGLITFSEELNKTELLSSSTFNLVAKGSRQRNDEQRCRPVLALSWLKTMDHLYIERDVLKIKNYKYVK